MTWFYPRKSTIQALKFRCGCHVMSCRVATRKILILKGLSKLSKWKMAFGYFKPMIINQLSKLSKVSIEKYTLRKNVLSRDWASSPWPPRNVEVYFSNLDSLDSLDSSQRINDLKYPTAWIVGHFRWIVGTLKLSGRCHVIGGYSEDWLSVTSNTENHVTTSPEF